MTWSRALLVGALGSALACGALTAWAATEPESTLVVAATEISPGTTITLDMLETREVPTRFFSKRKLGVTSVAGVMGREAPHMIRRGDFIDPTHFAESPDPCELDTRALARQVGVEGAPLEDFVTRLSAPPR